MRGPGTLLLLALAACSRGSANGELVDYDTGKPIAGATVAARSSGWGISSGQLVWDKSYSARASTDAEGRFTIPLPGPRPLTMGGTTISAEAEGYQRLSEIAVAGEEPLLLQAVKSVPRTQRAPGGIAYVGITESGRPFGWSFARNRATFELREADIFLLDSLRAGVDALTFASASPGGLLFVSRAEQRIAAASYGMFLRYANTAPPTGYDSSVTIDPLGSGGTIFVRTADDRFAKVAVATPLSTMRGSIPVSGVDERAAWALPLPFAYNPFPGRALAYDPDEPSGAVDPSIAGAAAELPTQDEPRRGARSYHIVVEDDAGALIDSVTVTLSPGVPVSAGDFARTGYRYRNITLSYGDQGLAAIRLSIESHAVVYNTADIIPNSRFPVNTEFQDFSSDYKPLRRTLRIIEALRTTGTTGSGL